MLSLKNLQRNVALAPFTTYKIGGPADYFVGVGSKNELLQAVSAARQVNMPYFILGTGANILVGDKGFRGLVIHNQAVSYHFANNLLIAESGASVGDLIEACAERGLSGLEHFAGIPSSVGGAIWQNLHFLTPDRKGTFFVEQIVRSAEILESSGDVMTVGKEYFKFGYDDSILHHKEVIVLEVTFDLIPKPVSQIVEQIRANLEWRNQKQPQLTEFSSCGSVFKKVEGVGSGRLIDNAGLKGKRVGGAEVSSKHANYLVNLGNATALDVRQLISVIQEEVKQKTGYSLEPEISFIGEF